MLKISDTSNDLHHDFLLPDRSFEHVFGEVWGGCSDCEKRRALPGAKVPSNFSTYPGIANHKGWMDEKERANK